MVTSILVYDFDFNKVDLLTKYKGKPLLLLFYNNNCLGCTGRAIPMAYNFQKLHSSIQVIGIHSNFGEDNVTEKEIKSIFTKKEIPFPIYIDKAHKMYDFFESEGTPQWVLITKSGVVYRSIFGSQAGVQNRLSYALETLVEE